MRRSAKALLLWTVLLAAPAPAPAGPQARQPSSAVVHRVKREDTLALLAAEYYGDRRYQVLIATANGLSPGQPLRPRSRLRIPVDQDVVTGVGATAAELAETYLGDPRRARFLIGFNDPLPGELPLDVPIAAGLEIRVPLHLRHTVAPEETLEALAKLYFGNPDKARLIREYNFLGEDAPAAGQELLVPIYHVSVPVPRRPALDAEARQRVARRMEMQQQAHAALAGARVAWAAGDYKAVQRLLAELDTDYLDAELAVEVAVRMGSAHVAFGDEEGAEAAFREALARKPSHALDPYQVSPKIRAIWLRAGGAVTGARGARGAR